MRHRCLAGLLFGSMGLFAQPGPQFEVASVRALEQGRMAAGPLRGGPGTGSPGRLSGLASMRQLLMLAYGLNAYQISGPEWMDSQRYEIGATIPAGATKQQVPLMMQSLLADRFHLAVHRETRLLPFYALVVGKRGPKFQAAAGETVDEAAHVIPKLERGSDGIPQLAAGAKVPRSYEVVTGGSDGLLYKLWARRMTMQQLAERLSSQFNQPVLDQTGLPGQYDFDLAWTIESTGGMVPRTSPPPDEIDIYKTPVLSDPGLSIFTAMQAQLGLKLEERKGPLPTLVVDRIDRTPTDN